MALDYGKMEFAVSFKPITAFPLDSRSYYESLAAAEAAAATAVEAGSDQGTIYFGQTIVVVENGAAQMLQVQPDGTLSEIGGKIEIDEHQFTIDKTTGKLNLFGFADAVAGAQLVIEEVEVEGQKVKQLKWVKPDTTTVEGLATAIADLETAQEALDTRVSIVETAVGAPAEGETAASGLYAEVNKKANAVDVYTKTETDNLLSAKANAADVYTKTETDTAIATAVTKTDHLKRKIVADKTAIETYINENDDAEQYIFMVPTIYEYTSESNKYDEYIVLSSGEGEEKVYTIEPVGSWAVDLDDYVSETELAKYLESYYTSKKVDEILAAYATIASVEKELENYYTIDQIGSLLEGYYTEAEIDALLATIYTKTEIDNKLSDIYTKGEVNDLLSGKVDTVEGKSLVSDTEIAKLETVKANAEPNYIKSVSSNFNVTESGQLNLNTLEIDNINGLQNALDEKVNKQYYTVPVVDENGDPVFEEDGVTPKMEQVEGALLSPTDKEKLDALVIGDNGVEISGKVNASNVEGLSEWVTDNRDKIAGLYSTTANEKLAGIEAGAQKNFITAVEENQFTVTDGKLAFSSVFTQNLSDLSDASTLHTTKIASLDKTLNGYTDDNGERVLGLVEVVNNFADTYITLSDFNTVVGNLDEMKSKNINLLSDVQAIQEALTWQSIVE